MNSFAVQALRAHLIIFYIDDILQHLAPTLKQYRNCDIIDISPGPALWSSKFHDYVKPRRHILVEPRKDLYLPFLQPMLDAPDSRYHLADLTGWSIADIWRPKRYLDAGLLPDQKFNAEHGGIDVPNRSLLILANMAMIKKSTGRVQDSHKQILEFIRALQGGTDLHSNGPVRMLMWMRDAVKSPFVPRTVQHRRRLTVLTEMSCDAEEVAGDESRVINREHRLDFDSSLRTMKRMEEQGIRVPPSRLGKIACEVRDASSRLSSKDVEKLSIADDPTNEVLRDWHQEWRELEQAFEIGKFSQIVGGPPGIAKRHARKPSGAKYSPEYERLRSLQHQETFQRKRKLALEDVLREVEKMDAMDLEISQADLDETQRQSKLEELDRRISQYKVFQEKFPSSKLLQCNFISDNRKASEQRPPLLQWDNRSAEPIGVTKDEFYLQQPLALLDFQPKSPRQFQLTPIQWQYLEVITEYLFGAPGHSIVTALNAIAPGAADAIIPQVPALQDPRKGGRRDSEQLRVRVLTLEMLRGIVLAFEEWPFGPSLVELQRGIRMDSRGSHDSD